MQESQTPEFNRVVFDTGVVRVGAFRCHPSHPSFHDTGPANNCCFVFPRTAVEIQHEHEPAFVANPNVVTFYNQGQAYQRNAISPDGDRCDWFGVATGIVREAVCGIDPSAEAHPERPFQFTRAWTDTSTYLLQRRVFEYITADSTAEPLAIEEDVLFLLERVIALAFRTVQGPRSSAVGSKQRDVVHWMEVILSERLEDSLTLGDIAGEIGLSVYHMCRMFRRATGTTMWQYRQKLRLRGALEEVTQSPRPLVDIALELGFSSHSHFTNLFHKEFGQTPSAIRAGRKIPSSHS
ncbi:MAG: AraC family transcriptional regulator [Terriglobales bacterium]